MAAIGPVSRAAALPASEPQVVLAAAVVASIAMGLTPADRWWVRAGIAVATGAVLLAPQGDLIALWLAGSLVLADWVVRRRRPLPILPPASRGSLAPVSIGVLLSAALGRSHGATWEPLAALAAAGGVTLLVSAFGGALERLGIGLRLAAGRVTTWVLRTGIGIGAIVVPWGARSLVRRHRTEERAAGWAARHRRPVRPRRPWVREALPPLAPSMQLRAGGATAVVALVLLSAVGAGAAIVRATSSSEDAGPTVADNPPAFEGLAWYPEYLADTHWAFREDVGWRALRDRRMLDVQTRHLNTADGVRRSWAPPACECRRLTVWMYGGSTTFGLGQRDHRTIASELARSAWAEGIALDVVNRGMPGHTHWTEADRFAWDLTVEEAPDLVIFYDGVNEIWQGAYLDDPESNHPWLAIEPTIEEIQKGARPIDSRPAPPGGRRTPLEPVAPRTSFEKGELAGVRYAASTAMSRATADAHDVPMVLFWQPSRTARPPIEGEPYGDDDYEQHQADLYRGARSGLPDEVIDLTGVFGDDRDAHYWDDVHHNETAAAIIGRAIFEELRPTIEDLRAAD